MTQRRYQILFVQPGTKSFAGIQRVVDDVCSQLATTYGHLFDVDVLYTTAYENMEIAQRPYRKIERLAQGRLELLRAIRNTASEKRYDLIIVPQVEPLVICWLACFGLGRRFALHLHGNPKREMTHTKAKILFWIMKHFVLKRLAAVFGTSPRQLQAFQRQYPSHVPHEWLGNPVRRFQLSDAQARQAADAATFVNVGRYCVQKGQDLLVEAFARVHALRPKTRLKLVGYGGTHPQLVGRIAELGLEDSVDLIHLPTDPQPALAQSDIYVSTSRWEGWSLAICEALRFGLPVVSTDCDFGPSDILTDTRHGVLVPNDDEDALVRAMLETCDTLDVQRSYAQVRKDHIDQYSIERIIHVHAAAIRAAAAAGHTDSVLAALATEPSAAR